jgi:hypothetical protein
MQQFRSFLSELNLSNMQRMALLSFQQMTWLCEHFEVEQESKYSSAILSLHAKKKSKNPSTAVQFNHK